VDGRLIIGETSVIVGLFTFCCAFVGVLDAEALPRRRPRLGVLLLLLLLVLLPLSIFLHV
jgi:hypothetical protein